jgi:hypothetical protein
MFSLRWLKGLATASHKKYPVQITPTGRRFPRSLVSEEIGVDALELVGSRYRHIQVVFDHEVGEAGAIDEDDL